MHCEEPDCERPRFWTSVAFFIVLVIIVAASVVSFVAVKELEERGRELTEQYCYSCHGFSRNEEFPSPNHPVDTSKLSDKKLMGRIVGNPSGIFPEKVSDQELILFWLRYMEIQDASASKTQK